MEAKERLMRLLCPKCKVDLVLGVRQAMRPGAVINAKDLLPSIREKFCSDCKQALGKEMTAIKRGE